MKNSGDIMYLMFKYFTGPICKSTNYRWTMYLPMTIRYCDVFGTVYNTLTFDCQKDIAILSGNGKPDKAFKIDDVAKELKSLGLLNDCEPTYLNYTDEELAMFTKDTKSYYNDDVWKLE